VHRLSSHAAAAVFIALGLAPLVLGNDFFVLFLTSFLIFVMLTTSLQFLMGFAGILSLGHAAFFGIGAYCSALLTERLGLPFILALPAAGLLAGVGGLMMSPIIRLRGIYFAMASFAFGIVISEVFSQWKTVTGGHDGLPMIPFAAIDSFVLDTPAKYYYLVLLFTFANYLLFRALLDSTFGRALNAMRQSETGARSTGLNIVALKVWAIVIATASAGVAGSLYAHLNGSVSPQMFHWSRSIALLTMVVVGGVQSMVGMFAATFLLLYLTQYLRFLSEYAALVNGAALVFFVVFLPDGLGGLMRDVRRAVMVMRTPKSSSAT
jgi:branched-chain amino acid transport system permease protein